MKSLILVAVVFAAAVVHADSDCPGFNPVEECKHCLYGESYNQYTVNPCNRTIYYHCEITRGYITAHEQTCARCFWFSKDTWGCTDKDPDCEPDHPDPFTESIVRHEDCCWRAADGPEGPYIQFYKQVSDRPGIRQDLYYYWVVNGWPYFMPCPDGTYFDINTCQCQICYPGDGHHPCEHRDFLVFCLDFDNDGAERGIWYNQDSTCSINSWSYDSIAHNSLLMPGAPCDIEVPYFQNNEFGEFTLCGWFKPATGSLSHDQGLAFNGGRPFDDCYPGSIEISLKGGYVFGEIKTDSSSPYQSYALTHWLAIQEDKWYRVCLSFNKTSLDLTVKERGTLPLVPADTVSIAAKGVTKRNKCNFMIGASFDPSGNQNFFHGLVDDWCFYRTAQVLPEPPRWV